MCFGASSPNRSPCSATVVWTDPSAVGGGRVYNPTVIVIVQRRRDESTFGGIRSGSDAKYSSVLRSALCSQRNC